METCSVQSASRARPFRSQQLDQGTAVQEAVQTASLKVATQQAHVRYIHTTVITCSLSRFSLDN
eukprot:934569-Amphidinium_carterae.1